MITTPEEKKGGLMYNMNKSFEFISIIEACGLTDLGFNGQPFTWCNQRSAEARVWKRLDRAMVMKGTRLSPRRGDGMSPFTVKARRSYEMRAKGDRCTGEARRGEARRGA